MNLKKKALKSVASGTFDETYLEDGFFVLTSKNENDTVEILEREIDSSYIQFHFCNKGSAVFVFNNGTYTLNINEDTYCGWTCRPCDTVHISMYITKRKACRSHQK